MARVVIRSPYDCQFDDEESVSPSRQGLASRHLLIAAGARQPSRTFLFQYHNSQWSVDCEHIGVSYKGTEGRKSPRSSRSLEVTSSHQRFEVKHTLDFNESANKRGGAIVSIVIRLLLDGSVVVCLSQRARPRGGSC